MSKFPFIISVVVAILALGYFVFVTDAAYGGHEKVACAGYWFIRPDLTGKTDV